MSDTGRIQLGMVGGGNDAFIGGVHRIASRIDDRFSLVAGALSSTPEKSQVSGKALDLPRVYDDFTQMAIKEYVKVFSSNLIYLQVLIDSLNTDEKNIEKARLLASILGYDKDQKISVLFKKVQHDYQSLQWL